MSYFFPHLQSSSTYLTYIEITAPLLDSPFLPLHLLLFAIQVTLTTATCLIDMLAWPTPTEEKIALAQIYVPYLIFGERESPLSLQSPHTLFSLSRNHSFYPTKFDNVFTPTRSFPIFSFHL